MRARTAATIALLLLAPAPVAIAHGTGKEHASERARGLVFAGLRQAPVGSPCEGGWELELPGRRVGCTHGPDPAPAGVDVTQERSLEEIAFFSGDIGGASTETSGDVYCDGDGVSGNRVQAVYAYPAGGADNFSAVAPSLTRWAAAADEAVNASAAKTGGVRHVRWVTSADCKLEVLKVALSSAGVASLSGTVSDFDALGLNRADRKYLVWVDAYVYCGVANVAADDRATQENKNNGPGRPGMVARVDRGCWGRAGTPLEVHELVHTLGGVQMTAPNAAGTYHCRDEYDVMCYDDDGTKDGLVWADGTLVPLRYLCPSEQERLLDCRGDDYFNTSPAQGSWLAKHWNVADSSFLTPEGPASAPDTTAPRSTAPKPTAVGRVGRRVPVRLAWASEDADVAGYWLWQQVDGGSWHYVSRVNLWETSAVLKLRRGHSYRYLVHAFDASGNASPAVLGPRFRVKLRQERSRAISYVGRWHRVYRSSASARHVAAPQSGWNVARTSFRGRARRAAARACTSTGATFARCRCAPTGRAPASSSSRSAGTLREGTGSSSVWWEARGTFPSTRSSSCARS
jgi:hypothetical protein